MIVVKIELWPDGNESAKSELGRLRIANVKDKKDGVSVYEAAGVCTNGDPNAPFDVMSVANVEHLRKEGVLHLLRRVLETGLPL